MKDCELRDEMTLSSSIAFDHGIYHSGRKLSEGEGLLLGGGGVGTGKDWPRQVRTAGNPSAVEQVIRGSEWSS